MMGAIIKMTESATGSTDTSSVCSFLIRELCRGMTVEGCIGFFSPWKREIFTVKVRRRGCRCQRQGLLLMELESWFSNYVPRIFTNGLPKIPHGPE